MSAFRVVEVCCDGPPDGVCKQAAARANYGTAEGVRATLREEGWKVGLNGGYDRCPECQERTKPTK